MAMGNPLWMEVLKGKSPINSVCSIAMFDYRKVNHRFLHGIVASVHLMFHHGHAGLLCIEKPMLMGRWLSCPNRLLSFMKSWTHELGWFISHYPSAPCIVKLPTCRSSMGHVLVNIPYIEHMGYMLIYVVIDVSWDKQFDESMFNTSTWIKPH